ncbi:MAG: type II secretion system protein [Planctomyces sp.]|nr:type II secretion system protein [Planctomyces sp.]
MSLIELLIVMSILAILAGTAFVMLGRTGEEARKAATLTTLRKLDSLLQARFDELRKNFDEQEKKKLRTSDWINIQNTADNHPLLTSLPMQTRLAVVRADRYRGTFPQREEDLFGIDDDEFGAVPDNSPLLTIWRNFNPGPKTDRNLESSELLYLALTTGVSSGAGKEILEDISPRHIQDKDGNGLPEIYDDWGNPLRFYNAPTRLVRPGGLAAPTPTPAQHALTAALIASVPPTPTGAPTDPGYFAQAFNQDPFDSRGALRTQAVFDAEAMFRTPSTFFRPMIVSCGADEQLGLHEPTEADFNRLGVLSAGADAMSEAADNLTNLQRVGG